MHVDIVFNSLAVKTVDVLDCELVGMYTEMIPIGTEIILRWLKTGCNVTWGICDEY